MAEEKVPQMEFKGLLQGHCDWVTSIVSGFSQKENEDSNVLVSGSRDKTLIIWKFNEESEQGEIFGTPYRQLTGHSHFVTDLALS
jgi:guanine nucleotide-binding protein subunit beta-2-like 1 protein